MVRLNIIFLSDCYIDICSPEVLSLFYDNFDYQQLRRHFVKGLLVDDIMGYKIFTHEIQSSYAARVDNFRSYDTISKDIMQRWTYPLVPDVQFSGSCSTKLERQGIYKASGVEQSRSAQILPFTFIGKGTTIGDHSKILNSVIGENCNIGSNASIEGSYIWNNVTIEDGCKLRHAIVCDGVLIKSRAVLEPGVVVSFEVTIGQQFVVPAYSKVSLLLQPSKLDSDEELEYADSSSGIIESPSMTSAVDMSSGKFVSRSSDSSEVGSSGAGYIWSVFDGGHEEEWRHSIAPIPAEKLIELAHVQPELDLPVQDGSILQLSGELQPDSDSDNSEDDGDGDQYCTLRERLSYNMGPVDCAGAIFQSVMKLALKSQQVLMLDKSYVKGKHVFPPFLGHRFGKRVQFGFPEFGELFESAKSVIAKWRDLLKQYIENDEEEVEVILKFEEMCLESAKEFSPVFDKILLELYDKDILSEDAILLWASEKKGADESDKVFVRQSEKFIKWLKEAEEEED
ncbi:hypothetical protein GIB67_037711 [Kingdonia uniflora]|uniref:W2 domain-containing protein n=1 Tax=Kingdonia uniflora TaxID=39325 RepID=A0A7J7LNB0_9MAGN|nr:hypothetical protein GIB67_037711 [Kingdonia uniflora]